MRAWFNVTTSEVLRLPLRVTSRWQSHLRASQCGDGNKVNDVTAHEPRPQNTKESAEEPPRFLTPAFD